MADVNTEIKNLRYDLSKKEHEFYSVLLKASKIAEKLVDTAGRNPAHLAYIHASEAYEKMIVSKMWLAQALEAIGEVFDDSYIPELPEEQEAHDIPSAS